MGIMQIPSSVSLAALSVLLAITTTAGAQQKTVAITVDDLPYVGGDGEPGSLPTTPELIEAGNAAILQGLRNAHAPATGFVIEHGVEEAGAAGSDVLQLWIREGFDLGNHTYSHSNLNDLSIEAFESEVVKGEKTYLPLMQKAGRQKEQFLRFPYNASGDTVEKHEQAAAFLAQRGYRTAPCTMEAEDYNFAAAYVRMLGRHDEASAGKLRDAYLAYTAEQIDYYARLNRQVLGYEPPEIMLIHDNKLNADVIEPLLKLFTDRGYKFVSLDQAEMDPVYKAPDTFVTKYGMMWGYRWARQRGVQVDGRLEKEPPAWIAQDGKN